MTSRKEALQRLIQQEVIFPSQSVVWTDDLLVDQIGERNASWAVELVACRQISGGRYTFSLKGLREELARLNGEEGRE